MEKEKEVKEKKIYLPIEIDQIKEKNQEIIYIQGIKIYFPYKIYEPQKIYMEKVISTLNKSGSISALESPTGTGKTLCLLCATLAWVKHNNKDISIYYCTRTVSQINNVLKELNKTCYKLNISFLTSRKYACLNFSKQSKKNMDNIQLRDICDSLRKRKEIILKIGCEEEKENKEEKRMDKLIKNNKIISQEHACKFYRGEDSFVDFNQKNELQDIEDLLNDGKNELFCPYFYNIFKTKKCANLTIMTYNYILDPYIRNTLHIFNKNSIIILDEAHNICGNLEKIDSRKINMNDLEKMKILLQVLLDFINQKSKNNEIIDEDDSILLFLDARKINQEINAIKDFMNYINQLNFDEIILCQKFDESKIKSYIVTIEFFKNIFQKFQTELYFNIREIYKLCRDKEKAEFNSFYKASEGYDKKLKLSSLMKLPNKIFEFLFHLDSFITNPNDIKKQYNYQIIIEKKRNKDNKENQINFEIICIDASYGLKEYLKLKPYSTLLTSGTLSINVLQNLLKTQFYEKLNNNHVINNSQFMINIIKGYHIDKQFFNYSFTYKNRNNITQIISLGNEIYNLAKSVKIGGILVFFQCFEYLEKCYKIWLENGTIKKFEKIKNPFFDLSFNRTFSEEIIMKGKRYNNLLLFTVYRGRSSEGINFSDDEARMVICIGVPYPKLTDIKVQLKKDFLDERNKRENIGFDGWKWYKEEAINAVNQSLGRLIRNINDYGIMICFGIEFSYNIQYLSKWIKNNKMAIIVLKENDNYYFGQLSKFLENLKYKFTGQIKDLNKIDSEESLDDYDEAREFEFSEDDDY